MTAPDEQPGRPRVPRPPWSRIAIAYAVIGLILGGWYVVAGLGGRDLIGSGGDVDQIPASVRMSPGGYRSFAFWHSGYEGGK
jgi:hypothetical protein